MLVGETGPPAQSRARATYCSVVSVALILSASESAVAPSSPMLLPSRLQRGEEGQGCWCRDRAAGTEQGARNLLERRQQAQCIRNLVTIPPASELLDHNCFGVHLCAACQAASNVRPLKTPRSTELDASSAFSRAASLFPSSCLLCAWPARARVFRAASNPIARRVLGVLGVRTRPARRLSAVSASVPPVPRPRAPSSCSTPCSMGRPCVLSSRLPQGAAASPRVARRCCCAAAVLGRAEALVG